MEKEYWGQRLLFPPGESPARDDSDVWRITKLMCLNGRRHERAALLKSAGTASLPPVQVDFFLPPFTSVIKSFPPNVYY